MATKAQMLQEIKDLKLTHDGSDCASCFQYVTAMPEEPKLTMFTHKTQ